MKKQSILAILIAALLVLTVFTGCAANSKMAPADPASMDSSYYDSTQEAAATETPMETPAEPEEEFAYDTVATTEAGSGAAETPEPDASVADYTAKIIYTASVSIETTEFDKAVAALESQVQKIGGFVESSNVTGDTQYNSDGTTSIVNRWAYYTVRIPCEQFEAFLHETEGFGNVISTSRDAQNVTSAYTDYEARLSSLNTQEERLLDMLSKSEDVETLIALEQRLSDVRYEIESIERSLRNYDMQIRYSTVELDLREVELFFKELPEPYAGLVEVFDVWNLASCFACGDEQMLVTDGLQQHARLDSIFHSCVSSFDRVSRQSSAAALSPRFCSSQSGVRSRSACSSAHARRTLSASRRVMSSCVNRQPAASRGVIRRIRFSAAFSSRMIPPSGPEKYCCIPSLPYHGEGWTVIAPSGGISRRGLSPLSRRSSSP